MANDLLSSRSKVPDFDHWESPETRIRWERGLAIIAGMIGVVLAFFFLYAVIPLSSKGDNAAITGQATVVPAAPQAAPAGVQAAAIQPTTAAPQPTLTTQTGQGLGATSRSSPNVRRGPSLDAQIIRQLSPGQKVEVVGRSPDNQWFQIVSPDNPRDRVWVSADMLDVTGDARTLPEVRP